jgi:hypothetical protein
MEQEQHSSAMLAAASNLINRAATLRDIPLVLTHLVRTLKRELALPKKSGAKPISKSDCLTCVLTDVNFAEGSNGSATACAVKTIDGIPVKREEAITALYKAKNVVFVFDGISPGICVIRRRISGKEKQLTYRCLVITADQQIPATFVKDWLVPFSTSVAPLMFRDEHGDGNHRGLCGADTPGAMPKPNNIPIRAFSLGDRYKIGGDTDAMTYLCSAFLLALTGDAIDLFRPYSTARPHPALFYKDLDTNTETGTPFIVPSLYALPGEDEAPRQRAVTMLGQPLADCLERFRIDLIRSAQLNASQVSVDSKLLNVPKFTSAPSRSSSQQSRSSTSTITKESQTQSLTQSQSQSQSQQPESTQSQSQQPEFSLSYSPSQSIATTLSPSQSSSSMVDLDLTMGDAVSFRHSQMSIDTDMSPQLTPATSSRKHNREDNNDHQDNANTTANVKRVKCVDPEPPMSDLLSQLARETGENPIARKVILAFGVDLLTGENAPTLPLSTSPTNDPPATTSTTVDKKENRKSSSSSSKKKKEKRQQSHSPGDHEEDGDMPSYEDCSSIEEVLAIFNAALGKSTSISHCTDLRTDFRTCMMNLKRCGATVAGGIMMKNAGAKVQKKAEFYQFAMDQLIDAEAEGISYDNISDLVKGIHLALADAEKSSSSATVGTAVSDTTTAPADTNIAPTMMIIESANNATLTTPAVFANDKIDTPSTNIAAEAVVSSPLPSVAVDITEPTDIIMTMSTASPSVLASIMDASSSNNNDNDMDVDTSDTITSGLEESAVTATMTEAPAATTVAEAAAAITEPAAAAKTGHKQAASSSIEAPKEKKAVPSSAVVPKEKKAVPSSAVVPKEKKAAGSSAVPMTKKKAVATTSSQAPTEKKAVATSAVAPGTHPLVSNKAPRNTRITPDEPTSSDALSATATVVPPVKKKSSQLSKKQQEALRLRKANNKTAVAVAATTAASSNAATDDNTVASVMETESGDQMAPDSLSKAVPADVEMTDADDHDDSETTEKPTVSVNESDMSVSNYPNLLAAWIDSTKDGVIVIHEPLEFHQLLASIGAKDACKAAAGGGPIHLFKPRYDECSEIASCKHCTIAVTDFQPPTMSPVPYTNDDIKTVTLMSTKDFYHNLKTLVSTHNKKTAGSTASAATVTTKKNVRFAIIPLCLYSHHYLLALIDNITHTAWLVDPYYTRYERFESLSSVRDVAASYDKAIKGGGNAYALFLLDAFLKVKMPDHQWTVKMVYKSATGLYDENQENSAKHVISLIKDILARPSAYDAGPIAEQNHTTPFHILVKARQKHDLIFNPFHVDSDFNPVRMNVFDNRFARILKLFTKIVELGTNIPVCDQPILKLAQKWFAHNNNNTPTITMSYIEARFKLIDELFEDVHILDNLYKEDVRRELAEAASKSKGKNKPISKTAPVIISAELQQRIFHVYRIYLHDAVPSYMDREVLIEMIRSQAFRAQPVEPPSFIIPPGQVNLHAEQTALVVSCLMLLPFTMTNGPIVTDMNNGNIPGFKDVDSSNIIPSTHCTATDTFKGCKCARCLSDRQTGYLLYKYHRLKTTSSLSNPQNIRAHVPALLMCPEPTAPVEKAKTGPPAIIGGGKQQPTVPNPMAQVAPLRQMSEDEYYGYIREICDRCIDLYKARMQRPVLRSWVLRQLTSIAVPPLS